MAISKLKQLQRYLTSFEIYYRKFERKPQRHQLSIEFDVTMEQVFETLEIADIDMTNTSSPTMVETIFNRNFVNTFHHQNGTNQ